MPSEVLGELLEIAQRLVGIGASVRHGIGDAMLHVIMDQGALYRADRALDGLELLRQIKG